MLLELLTKNSFSNILKYINIRTNHGGKKNEKNCRRRLKSDSRT